MKKFIKNNWKKFITIIILLGISFILTMQSGFNYFNKSNIAKETDGTVFNCIGWLMVKGLVPYRDIFDHKGIFLYFLEYIGSLIGKYRGIYLIEVLFITASIFVTYKILRKFGSNRKLSIFAILVIFARYSVCGYGNCCEEFSVLFQVISLYFFLDFFENPGKYIKNNFDGLKKQIVLLKFFDVRVFVLGICFACVFLMKANFCAMWIVFGVAIAVHCIEKKYWKDLVKFIISFVLGALIIILPSMIYLYKNGAMSDFIYDYFTFNSLYSSNITRVNIKTRVNSFITFTNTIPCMLAFLIMIVRIAKKDKKYFTFDILYLIYMIVAILLTTMSGQTYPKMEIAILPILIYPFAQFNNKLMSNEWKKNQTSLIIIGFLALILVIPSWMKLINNAATYISQYVDFPYQKEENKIIEYIKENTNENDRISVLGNECAIYVYSNRLPSSKYIFLPDPKVDEKIVEEYFQNLTENLPKVIVISTTYKAENQFVSDKMEDFLETYNYELVFDEGKPVYRLNEN